MRTKADIELVSDSPPIRSSKVLFVKPASTAAFPPYQAARSELQSALANKGGHRVKAIALVDQAIAETNEGIRVGRGD